MEMGGADPQVAAQHMDWQDWEEVRRMTGCTSDEACFEELKEIAEHPRWFCSGEFVVSEGGSKVGHILPGVFFMIWAAHWLFGQARTYHRSKVERKAWTSQSSFQLWRLPFWLESFFKATLPVLAMMLEMWLVHEHGFRNLMCPKGSPRAGHFVGNHINNWQHASLYPPIMASGLVDLLNCKFSLPKGTTQLFLSFIFGSQALLIGLHKKHNPLDVITHEMIFWCMVAILVLCLCEIAMPNNVMFALGRSTVTMLVGMWLLAMSQILFTGDPMWDHHKHDQAPAMYAPIIFVMLSCLAFFITVCTYLVVQYYYQRQYKSHHTVSLQNWKPARNQEIHATNFKLHHSPNRKGQGSSSSECSEDTGCGSEDVHVDIGLLGHFSGEKQICHALH